MEFEISQVVITIVVTCLIMWRISYGINNGLFAEATGLIAVIAAFASVYYLMLIAGDILNKNFGDFLNKNFQDIITKIACLFIAFIVYRIMTAIGKALRRIKEIPVLGSVDRLLGAILGAGEAIGIIFIVEFVTGFKFFEPTIATIMQVYEAIRKTFINI